MTCFQKDCPDDVLTTLDCSREDEERMQLDSHVCSDVHGGSGLPYTHVESAEAGHGVPDFQPCRQ